ncbi:immunity 22 family protein [Photobacterium sp. WH24]|uniref:Immunity 22 family protein n=1 Tax=Photobacterium arenosum TaxID=2774143 RepID=A0ABR9BNR8_9GAMM|nr:MULTISPECIES: immunity 22 family protein [Photobacterium]MBD8514216.1 immunity 22 family protein [Photobacterium arenosum]MBV7263519.1 immunity 22 family protein [Photobacterium sp. WH24]
MRYGGPNFEKKGFVSIWVSKVTLDEIPDDYFEERFGEDYEDTPLSQWCENFGFGYYDHDQIEDNGVEIGADTLDRILGECSYSKSYVEQAVSKAKEKGLGSASWIRNFFDFSYSPESTGIDEDQFMIFLGAFEYDTNSESKYESQF